MNRISTFGLVALIPAALNVSAAASAATLTMPLCTGDGQVRLVEVPLEQAPGPGKNQGPCCAKGCHAGGSRKKAAKQFEPSQ